MHKTTQKRSTEMPMEVEKGVQVRWECFGPLPLPSTPWWVTSVYISINKSQCWDPERLIRTWGGFWESAAWQGKLAMGNGGEHGERKEHLYLPKNPEIFLKAACVSECSREKVNLGGQISHLAATPPISIPSQPGTESRLKQTWNWSLPVT